MKRSRINEIIREGDAFIRSFGYIMPPFAYWRPDDGIVWASYMRDGYIYTADRNRGVDILRLTAGAKAARRSGQEVIAPPQSARQRRFLAKVSKKMVADPATGFLCYFGA